MGEESVLPGEAQGGVIEGKIRVDTGQQSRAFLDRKLDSELKPTQTLFLTTSMVEGNDLAIKLGVYGSLILTDIPAARATVGVDGVPEAPREKKVVQILVAPFSGIYASLVRVDMKSGSLSEPEILKLTDPDYQQAIGALQEEKDRLAQAGYPGEEIDGLLAKLAQAGVK